jgi:hypothetical protein
VTAYRVPRPVRSGPADAGNLGAEKWLCGIAASYERWPQDEYTFRVPPCALPLYAEHREEMLVPAGEVPAVIGAARRFREIEGVGLVSLIEVGGAHPSVVWDVAAGRRAGLSIGYCLDPPPDGGPEWICLSEVSLTGTPGDPRARVISSGQLALDDWRALTGEAVSA